MQGGENWFTKGGERRDGRVDLPFLSHSLLLHCTLPRTIKGGSRRAEKSRKVLMMMKAAKLGWAGSGAGQEQTMSRPGAGWEHARSRPGAMQEQGRSKSRAGALTKLLPKHQNAIDRF